jgi:hypothetical protein
MLGVDFDFFFVPATHTCGGILLAWHRNFWSATNPIFHGSSLTAKLYCNNAEEQWWITCVYGPQGESDELQFLEQLGDVRRGCEGPWLLCGDFNLIYKAEDKNNAILNRRMMGRFRRFIDDNKLQELHLNGRRFTWSSERDNPTLERLDRVFATEDWLLAFPNHELNALSSECSDHAPLKLTTVNTLHTFKRFHFENIWPKFEGFLQVVEEAWVCPWPDADAFRVLDYKLRNTAKALQSWSAKHVGSVRLQLAIAKELVLHFDVAQESRVLAAHELRLRRKAKANCLGLASMLRTIIRQRSRITNIAECDANTRYFHLQACHRKRKSHIDKVNFGGAVLIEEEEKAEAFVRHFEDLLGIILSTLSEA